jgi:hypothetical protein
LIEDARQWRTATTCAARAQGADPIGSASDPVSTRCRARCSVHSLHGEGHVGPFTGGAPLGEFGFKASPHQPRGSLAPSREESEVCSSRRVTSQTPTRTEHGLLQYSEAEPITTLLQTCTHQAGALNNDGTQLCPAGWSCVSVSSVHTDTARTSTVL